METTLPPLHIEPPLHRRRLDFFRKSFVFSTIKAQRLLGFKPAIDFQSGRPTRALVSLARPVGPRAAGEVAQWSRPEPCLQHFSIQHGPQPPDRA